MGLGTEGDGGLSSELFQSNRTEIKRTYRNSDSRSISTVSEAAKLLGVESTNTSRQQRGDASPLILWRVMNLPSRGSRQNRLLMASRNKSCYNEGKEEEEKMRKVKSLIGGWW